MRALVLLCYWRVSYLYSTAVESVSISMPNCSEGICLLVFDHVITKGAKGLDEGVHHATVTVADHIIGTSAVFVSMGTPGYGRMSSPYQRQVFIVLLNGDSASMQCLDAVVTRWVLYAVDAKTR